MAFLLATGSGLLVSPGYRPGRDKTTVREPKNDGIVDHGFHFKGSDSVAAPHFSAPTLHGWVGPDLMSEVGLAMCKMSSYS